MCCPKIEKTTSRYLVVSFALLILAAAIPAAAQSQAPQNAPDQTVVKKLAYVDAIELENILKLFDINYVVQPTTNTIVIRGNPETITGALRAIEVLDQPSPNIELTMYVVAASKDKRENGSVPEKLQPVVEQLHGVFGYRGFELLDEVSLNVMAGHHGLVEGGLPLRSPGTPGAMPQPGW